MDPTALLILPLVGGYIFAYRWNGSRYFGAREEGHRLYFRAAFYGVWLFVATALLHFYLVAEVSRYEHWSLYARQELEPSFSIRAGKQASLLAIICIGSFLLGAFGWWPLNLVTPKGIWLRRVVNEEGDMEELFHRALARGIPVLLTMDNKKVYVGFVQKSPEPRPVSSRVVWVLPLMSGYRDETGKVRFTTFYDQIYADLENQETETLSLEDFEIVLPTENIHSAGFFDPETYQKFQRIQPPALTSDELHRARKSWRPHYE